MKVLIATDGHRRPRRRPARPELLEAFEIVLLAVIGYVPGEEAGGFAGPVESPEEGKATWEREQDEARQVLKETAAVLGDVPVLERFEAGDAGAMICFVAEDVDADVVVIGSHGKGAFKRMLLGSVSHYVIHNAPCPVLVVRQGAGPGEGPRRRGARGRPRSTSRPVTRRGR